MQDITKVLTPDLIDTPHPESPHHRANGQFARGNSASPGRKKRAEEQALLAVMNEVLPAEELKSLLTEAIAWAREYKSPKLVLAIAQFIVGYQIGTPIQRSMSASTKLETILARVGSLDDDEFNQVEAAMRDG